MSEHLGPIHYMMYEKIKFQDKISDYLVDNKSGELSIEAVPTQALDEILDQENIHGFLQAKIDQVEARLLEAFTISKDTDQKLYDFGKITGKDKDFSSFNTIFNDLNMYLLDGMPCDNGLAAGVDGDSLYLITNNNLHLKYEKEKIRLEDSLNATCEGGHGHDHHENFDLKENVDLNLKDENSSYHKHRLAFLRGYFSNSPYQVELVNGINYRIFK